MYYTSRTINSIKQEISSLHSKEDYDDLRIEELSFSMNTQTVSTIIPLSSIKNDVSDLDLKIITISNDTDEFQIFVPKSDNFTYEIGQDVSATTISFEESKHFPIYLSINNKTLIRSNLSDDYSYSDLFFDDINHAQQIQLNGFITQIEDNTISDSSINSLVSNEMLNLISQNYVSLVNYNNGFYYFTNDTESQDQNLVFYSTIDLNGSTHVLISVYQMQHIEEIVRAAGTANVYMIIVVLLILIISSFIYSREFSRPLLFINKATKELSRLNFNNPLIKIDSTDEFGQLAKNINILSINLRTTLHQLSEQNKQLIDNLEKENKLEASRREFVSGMSHELKTPLAIIQASAEAIENGIYDTIDEKNNALQLIQNEVHKTNSMIKSMMNVYKLDLPNYEQEWKNENIKDIITEVNKSLSLLYNNSNIKVEMNLVDAQINCNRERIELVITNLFTNAIKYTPEGEKIVISLTNDKNYTTFSITNYGSSINDFEISKIFEPFYRIDKSRSRNEGSTGLGLYIVQQTLKQYNTHCDVQSDDNSVTFTFKIKSD